MNINDVLNLIEVVAHGIHFFQGRILALTFKDTVYLNDIAKYKVVYIFEKIVLISFNLIEDKAPYFKENTCGPSSGVCLVEIFQRLFSIFPLKAFVGWRTATAVLLISFLISLQQNATQIVR